MRHRLENFLKAQNIDWEDCFYMDLDAEAATKKLV